VVSLLISRHFKLHGITLASLEPDECQVNSVGKCCLFHFYFNINSVFKALVSQLPFSWNVCSWILEVCS